METQQVLEELQQLNLELFGEKGEGITFLSRFDPPFDVSRPNIHDTKKEFTRELTTVEQVLEHARGIIGAFTDADAKGSDKHREMMRRLATSVSGHARDERRKERIESPADLILSNLANDDFFHNTLLAVYHMIDAYEKRLLELKEQEAEFWSVSHRPPNYYARTIALRFAKHFAGHRRMKPTFGTSRDGNHASTEFGRGLEKVFSILDIRADVRKAAEWAIDQLTDADVNPPISEPRGSFLNAVNSNQQSNKSTDAIETTANMLLKGR